MTNNDGKYNIKAICTMLGIQPGTLRAWERRYNIIEPVRNQAGHRLYTDEHVAILRWLTEKVNKGFTIGQAVGLLEKGNYSFDESEVHSPDITTNLYEQVLEALLSFRENKAHEILNQAFSIFNVEKVILEILGPLLIKVGDLWESNKITIAHEHFVTSFIRTKISSIFHSFPIDGLLPRVVAVCGPRENHELGLLIFSLFLRRKGFEVIYLGAGIPENDLQVVLDEVSAKFLFTSCTMPENLDHFLTFIENLSKKKNQLNIGMGGAGLTRMQESDKEKYKNFLVGETKAEWEAWLSSRLYR